MKFGGEYYKRVIETISDPKWSHGDISEALLAAHDRVQELERLWKQDVDKLVAQISKLRGEK